MKKILFFLLIIPIPIYAQGQIDSLKLLLNRSPDTAKVNLLIKLSDAYLENSNMHAQVEAENALKLSTSINNEKLKGISSLQLGRVFHAMGKYRLALQYYKNSFNIFVNLDVRNEIAKSLAHMGFEYYALNEYDLSIDCFTEVLKISEEINNFKLQQLALTSLGTTYYTLSMFELALEYHLKDFEIIKNMKNKRVLSASLYSLGSDYSALCVYDKAIACFLESLRISDDLEDKLGVARCYHAIGLVYQGLNNFAKALEYNFKALKVRVAIKDKYLISSSLSSIGTVYYHLSKFDTAKSYFQQGLEIEKEIDYKPGIAISYDNIGSIYFQLGEYDTALSYYKKAYEIIFNFNDKWRKSKILNHLGLVFVKMKKYDSAINNLNQSLHFAKATKAKDLIQDSYSALSEYHSATGDFFQAYKYLYRYSILRDSVFTESSHKISEMYTRYETEKKEKENEILKRNNAIQQLELKQQALLKWLLFFGFLTVSIFVVFTYYRYTLKSKLNKTLNKKIKEALAKQDEQRQIIIHQASLTSLGEIAAGIAHEIVQPLQDIKLCMESIFMELKKKSPDLSFIKKMVKETLDDTIRIENTIGHVRLFASDQKTKVIEEFNINDIIKNTLTLIKRHYMKEKIYIDYKLDDKIGLVTGNPFNFEHVILNLLSNSRDALAEKSKFQKENFKKEISISSQNNNNEIIVEIEDNGVGIPKEIQSKIFHPFFTTKEIGKGTGLGLSIVYGIVKEMKGKIEFESQNKHGTIARIRIPIH